MGLSDIEERKRFLRMGEYSDIENNEAKQTFIRIVVNTKEKEETPNA